MPKLSTLSNPTGLLEIEKSRIILIIDEDGPAFSLLQLNVDDLPFSEPLEVIAIIQRGNSEERCQLGTTSSWNKGFISLKEIGNEGTWRFRVLLKESNSPKLIATAENIKPRNDDESESFIALEAADLGEIPWEIEIFGQLGQAVLRFNKKIFRSAGEAAADKPFMYLVLPEALRQLAQQVCQTNCLEDEPWHHFRDWLYVHGVSEFSGDKEDFEEVKTWCNEVVEKFCNRFKFSSSLLALRLKGEEE